MSRDDLLATNMGIMNTVTRGVAAVAPNAVLIIVSNPLDAMCHAAYNAGGFPRTRSWAWRVFWIPPVFGRSSPWS